MTQEQVLAWSAARAVIVALLALLPVTYSSRFLRSVRPGRQRVYWTVAVLTPFFIPELLTGYTYRLTATRYEYSSAATELLYGLLMIVRCSVVGVVIDLMVRPGRCGAESLHSWRLLHGRLKSFTWWSGWMRLHCAGHWKSPLICVSLMALICFQEFETAALMQIDRFPVAWTVTLFDAHAAFQPLRASLFFLAKALLIQGILLLPALAAAVSARSVLVLTDDSTPFNRLPSVSNQKTASGNQQRMLTGVWILIAWSCVVVWPMAAGSASLADGISLLWNSRLIPRSLPQIAVSLGFAAAAAVISLWLSTAVLGMRNNFARRCLLVILVLPGLCGSLFVSVAGLALFQVWPWRMVYDTWLPLLIGLSINVLPRSLLAVILLRRLVSQEALFSARLLLVSGDSAIRRQAADVLWRQRTRGGIIAAMVVCHWCFWDVTVSSVLRSAQVEPVVNRLYNEMHYGRVDALPWISLLSALATPMLAVLLVLALKPAWWRSVTTR